MEIKSIFVILMKIKMTSIFCDDVLNHNSANFPVKTDERT